MKNIKMFQKTFFEDCLEILGYSHWKHLYHGLLETCGVFRDDLLHERNR